jgi:hypothetical protein
MLLKFGGARMNPSARNSRRFSDTSTISLKLFNGFRQAP